MLMAVVGLIVTAAISGGAGSAHGRGGARGRGGAADSVYFGSGCFWEQQRLYVSIEQSAFHRNDTLVTAHVGYAGSTSTGASGHVCYHGSGIPANSDYSTLGYAEVVEVTAESDGQFDALVAAFFASYSGPPGQRARPDQDGDWGAEYRSCIGLPGGVHGPRFAAVQKANSRWNMSLVAGQGAADQDALNTVFIYDTARFPFVRGERAHQFHCNFGGMDYGRQYEVVLYAAQAGAGLIDETGCCASGASGLGCDRSMCTAAAADTR